MDVLSAAVMADLRNITVRALIRPEVDKMERSELNVDPGGRATTRRDAAKLDQCRAATSKTATLTAAWERFVFAPNRLLLDSPSLASSRRRVVLVCDRVRGGGPDAFFSPRVLPSDSRPRFVGYTRFRVVSAPAPKLAPSRPAETFGFSQVASSNFNASLK
uniref:Uncharacterized protein n=1 Tax=Plectus sambesii TaxID=2011161 RepID=A0A914USF4_9BILA